MFLVGPQEAPLQRGPRSVQPCFLHREAAWSCVTDRLIDRQTPGIIGRNSLQLLHSMRPKNTICESGQVHNQSITSRESRGMSVVTVRSRMHGACMRKTYIFLLLTVLMLPSLGLSRSADKMFDYVHHFACVTLLHYCYCICVVIVHYLQRNRLTALLLHHPVSFIEQKSVFVVFLLIFL